MAGRTVATAACELDSGIVEHQCGRAPQGQTRPKVVKLIASLILKGSGRYIGVGKKFEPAPFSLPPTNLKDCTQDNTAQVPFAFHPPALAPRDDRKQGS